MEALNKAHRALVGGPEVLKTTENGLIGLLCLAFRVENRYQLAVEALRLLTFIALAFYISQPQFWANVTCKAYCEDTQYKLNECNKELLNPENQSYYRASRINVTELGAWECRRK